MFSHPSPGADRIYLVLVQGWETMFSIPTPTAANICLDPDIWSGFLPTPYLWQLLCPTIGVPGHWWICVYFPRVVFIICMSVPLRALSGFLLHFYSFSEYLMKAFSKELASGYRWSLWLGFPGIWNYHASPYCLLKIHKNFSCFLHVYFDVANPPSGALPKPKQWCFPAHLGI